MTKGEFSRALDGLKPVLGAKGGSPGDDLQKKTEALRELERLSRELTGADWSEAEVEEAAKELLELRLHAQSGSRYEKIRAQLGRDLSQAAGGPGGNDTYSASGASKNIDTPAPSRVDRTF